MPFSLKEFNAEINKSGIANPSYFAVLITLPEKLISNFPQFGKSMLLRIESASLPTRSILTHDQRYYGPIRRIPYGFTAMDLTMSIILSEDMREREVLMRWQDLMLGNARTRKDGTGSEPIGIFDAGYYEDAVQGASIELFTYATSPEGQGGSTRSLIGELGNLASAVGFDPSIVTNPLGFNLSNTNRTVKESYSIQLVEPFPLAINEIPMSWSSGNEYARLNVVFQHRYTREKNTKENNTKDSSLEPISDFVRNGISAFNRFRPVVSFIRSNNMSGLLDTFGGQIRPDI